MVKQKKIGLALGSGAARGYAHIGVLKVLEKNNIPIDLISGSSIGSVVGALYAENPDIKELEKYAKTISWKKMIDVTIPRYGLIKGDKIEKTLREKLGNKTFGDLKIPLYVSALDLETQEEIIFNKGDVVKAVRSSISIPGIFNPVINNNRVLVDGGIIDPLPIEILRKMGADIIIAVNITPLTKNPKISIEESINEKETKETPNITKTIFKVLQILEENTTRNILKKTDADIIISANPKKINLIDFHKMDEAIKAGEESALQSIDEIKRLTKKTRRGFFGRVSELLSK